MVGTGPCVLCDTPTRSHQLFPNANLCHKCFISFGPSDVEAMKEKAMKIVAAWIDARFLVLAEERKHFIKMQNLSDLEGLIG